MKVKVKLDYGSAELICEQLRVSVQQIKQHQKAEDRFSLMYNALIGEVYILFTITTVRKYSYDKTHSLTVAQAVALEGLLSNNMPPIENVYKNNLYTSIVNEIKKQVNG